MALKRLKPNYKQWHYEATYEAFKIVRVGSKQRKEEDITGFCSPCSNILFLRQLNLWLQRIQKLS